MVRNYRGDVLLMSFKDVGICGSNEEEVLPILEGLRLFSKRYVGALFFSFSHAPTKSLGPKRESAHIHGRQPTRKGKESTHAGRCGIHKFQTLAARRELSLLTTWVRSYFH